jgi:caa(3)-type oxidase subunit IV
MRDEGYFDAAKREPPYVAIWAVLIAALLVSLVLASLHHPGVAAALIFTIAAVKAYLVLAYYMHLKFEPRFIVLIVVGGIVCMAILFFGLTPDIVHVYGG